jgi:tetratricopeptide (TPR) repeat protein
MRVTQAATCDLILRCLSALLGATLFALIAMAPAVAQQGNPDAIFKRFRTLQQAGNYDEALVQAQQFEAAIKARFGANHTNYAAALNLLAVVYRAQGKYAEAERLQRHALAIREKILDRNHPEIAETLANLALVLDKQGKYGEAEGLYQRALAIREKVFGSSSPNVAHTLNGLALVYESQGKYSEAEEALKRALALREKALGASHRDVADTLNNLAGVYEEQGRYAEAEEIHRARTGDQRKDAGRGPPRRS